VAWYRCHTPGMALKRAGYEVLLTDQPSDKDIELSDVLVLERLWQPALVDAVKQIRSNGTFVVFDLDDDYWSIPALNPVSEIWDTQRLRGLTDVMRSCDLVTVPTKALADQVRKFVDRVRVLPNMLPEEYWPAVPPARQPRGDGPLVVGWAGSSSHVADFSVVRSIAIDLLERHPEVELHLAGAQPDWIEPHDRIRFIDSVSIEEYPNILAGFDIGIAPLEDTRFNRSKSDLKFLEYGMIGLPVVASKVGPYPDCIRHGENGLLASSPKDWLKHLTALVEDASLRERLGCASRENAERRLMGDHTAKWESAYGLGA
jgi:glycosyltransferase involved in cell wall biosynthesis